MRIGRRVVKLCFWVLGGLPVDPRRRPLVRLHLRDRRQQCREVDPPICRALPARLGPRPGQGADPPVHGRAETQQYPDLPADRRRTVPDAARAFPARPGEHAEARARRARRARGRRRAADLAALPAPRRDVERPGPARRPLARALARQHTAHRGPERDSRAGLPRGLRRRPDGARGHGPTRRRRIRPRLDATPRGQPAARAGQGHGVPLRGDGQGRHPRSAQPLGDVRHGDGEDRLRGRTGRSDALGGAPPTDPAPVAAGTQGPGAQWRGGRPRSDLGPLRSGAASGRAAALRGAGPPSRRDLQLSQAPLPDHQPLGGVRGRGRGPHPPSFRGLPRGNDRANPGTDAAGRPPARADGPTRRGFRARDGRATAPTMDAARVPRLLGPVPALRPDRRPGRPRP